MVYWIGLQIVMARSQLKAEENIFSPNSIPQADQESYMYAVKERATD